MSRKLALLIAAAFVAIALAVALGARGTHPGAPYDLSKLRGTPLSPPKVARDAILTNGEGAATHVIDPAYPTTMLFFGYTHCPDACPLALGSLAKAYRDLPRAIAARTRIVFVTVDPARDTPAAMRTYARAFDPHIVALTGSRARLAELWSAYGVAVDARTHEIAHGDAIDAIDASAHVVAIYPSDVSASDLAADMRVLGG